MQNSILLKDIDYIYTFNSNREIIKNGFILIKNNKIKKIGKNKDRLPKASTIIRQNGKIVLPGMINTHHHFFQSVTRAIPITQKCSLLDWLKTLYCLWFFLEVEDIKIATEVAIGELMLTGCTTSSDFNYFFPCKKKDFFDQEIEVAKKLGFRLHAIRGCIPVLEGQLYQKLREINLNSELIIEDKQEILRESERVINKYHDISKFSMLQIGLGPTTIDYKDQKFMKELKELANSKKLMLHFHLHPREDEIEMCRKLYKKRPLECLEEIGLLNENTWIAHATNFTPKDIKILICTGTKVSHSPSSNMRLGVKVAPIPLMHNKGVIVGLGVDGGASNDSGNMLGELRTTMMVHRIRNIHDNLKKENWFTPEEIFRMATVDGAKLLGRDDALGSLEEGKAADLISYNMENIGYAGGGIDPLSALIYCGHNYRVNLSIINGKIVVQNEKLLKINEQDLVKNANRITKKLLNKAKSLTNINFFKQSCNF